jgi:nitrite reductase/ring-hydroxylating ferredoxin subunit
VRFYGLEKLINLHDNYMCHFRIDHRELLLLQRHGEVFLIESRCPHRGHPLDAGTIDRGVIECALHQYRFELEGGRLLQATEEPCRGLRTYPVVFEGNEVGVMLEEEDDSP